MLFTELKISFEGHHIYPVHKDCINNPDPRVVQSIKVIIFAGGL